MEPIKVIVVLSGGLDSTTLLYDAIAEGYEVIGAVSFNYGQRHKKELDYAKATCEKLFIKHTVIDLWASGLTEALSVSKSSLVSDTDVPEGHYAEDNMKATVVPNRNMIMLSIAGGMAVAEGAHGVVTGVHAGDHFIYPDCRPEFIQAASRALSIGNEGFGHLGTPAIIAPYMNYSKAHIALTAFRLGVPLDETWSCYKGGEIHCGKCGTCVERLEAIDEAQRMIKVDDLKHVYCIDPTEYEDTQFWKQVVANA